METLQFVCIFVSRICSGWWCCAGIQWQLWWDIPHSAPFPSNLTWFDLFVGLICDVDLRHRWAPCGDGPKNIPTVVLPACRKRRLKVAMSSRKAPRSMETLTLCFCLDNHLLHWSRVACSSMYLGVCGYCVWALNVTSHMMCVCRVLAPKRFQEVAQHQDNAVHLPWIIATKGESTAADYFILFIFFPSKIINSLCIFQSSWSGLS